MRKIAVIIPESSGGVKVISNKLITGLSREGFRITRIDLYGKNRIMRIFKDLRNIKILHNFNAVIYMGSIAYSSSWFIRGLTRVLVFLHGFVAQEIISGLNEPYMSIKEKIKSLYLLQSWNFNKLLKRADLYICHSITTCEMNEINENFIILPQFIFQEEVDNYNKLYKILNKDSNLSYNEVKILAYTSPAPRLLQPYDIIRLIKGVSKKLSNRRVQLLIIDPRVEEEQKEFDNLKIKFIKPIARYKFLQLLAQADLYLESCIDEELRLTSIEAALLGTPIAKLTYPEYVKRQDYKDEVLWAFSPQKFVDTLSDYMLYLDYWKPYYAKRLRNFLITRRNWDSIKIPLVKYILDIY